MPEPLVMVSGGRIQGNYALADASLSYCAASHPPTTPQSIGDGGAREAELARQRTNGGNWIRHAGQSGIQGGRLGSAMVFFIPLPDLTMEITPPLPSNAAYGRAFVSTGYLGGVTSAE